jgi:hypothetical protein
MDDLERLILAMYQVGHGKDGEVVERRPSAWDMMKLLRYGKELAMVVCLPCLLHSDIGGVRGERKVDGAGS